MNGRSLLAALGASVIALLLAACGDNSATPGATNGPTTTVEPAGITHPTGADDVVLRIADEGGFVAPSYDFARTPALLISGDGRVIVPGAVPAIYPGPLLPTLLEGTIDEDGIQAVLAAAAAAGLLATPPDYSLPEGIGIADATTTVVTIGANGTTYVHRAYALGIDVGRSTPARDRLLAFVNLMTDLPKVAGATHLGTQASLVADAYRLRARQVDPSQFTEPKPTVVTWPSGTGIALKDAEKCARLDASKVGTLFTSANQLTFFEDAGIVYQLAVVQILPGDTLCA